MTNWTTKPKIAAASGVLGLFVGVGMGGQPDDEAVNEADAQARTLVQKAEAKADARVEEALADAKKSDQAAIDEAVDAAVMDAVATEKAKRKRLIKAAVKKAVAKTKASAPKPATLVDANVDSTDPRFDTCGAANAAGYGNYRQGADPEYDWYQDRDGDGFVCE